LISLERLCRYTWLILPRPVPPENLAPVEFERRSQKNRITEPKILNL
jgi:hypothetical protein